jgi:hypothetical protein
MVYAEYIPVSPLQKIAKLIWIPEDASGVIKDYEKISRDGCAEMILILTHMADGKILYNVLKK